MTRSSAPEKPKAFTIRYKRPRGSRACMVCRSRKVRCDAEIHIPCTNCITFGCDCVLPAPKKRGNGSVESKSKRARHAEDDASAGGKHDIHVKKELDAYDQLKPDSNPEKYVSSSSEPVLNISQVSVPPSLTSRYKNRPSAQNNDLVTTRARASLTFLGSSSVGFIPQAVGENHVHLSDEMFEGDETSLDAVELEILKLRGAFYLPSKELSLDLINTYFEYVHPLMPVLNRTEFMRKFNDPSDSPPLMLLQAVLLCGCRISRNPLLLDSKGSSNLACLTFFRRAKALYETNYESDPVAILQTLILIGSYWEGPEDVTKNSFYWTRVAIALAQGFGFHRDISRSPIPKSEKKTWRRIWWCLFEKDRNVAIAFGRPPVIDLSDCDVPMLTLDDFNEDDEEQGIVSDRPVNETHALYFIHLVKLAEITGIIIRHQYTVKAEAMKKKSKYSIIQHCDMLMGIWFTNLPPQLSFSLHDESKQDFFSCLLNAQYYNRLYLIHRSNLVRMAKSNSSNPNNYKYPSWGISFQSARMISIISKILLDKHLIVQCPVVFVYIVYSALLMLIYHVDSTNSLIASTASDSLRVLRAAMNELSHCFPIAPVLLRMFEKFADNKMKRAQFIEKGSRIAMFQELTSAERAKATENSLNSYYGNHSASNFNNKILHRSSTTPNQTINHQSPTQAISSGISPKGEVYEPHKVDPTKSDFEKMVKDTKQDAADNSESSVHSKSSNSPNSTGGQSIGGPSFPDISFVTEKLPTNQNFFENFDPTQLFPEVKVSQAPTRVQSPAISSLINHDDPDNRNDPQTPGSVFNNTFIDNTFINMNLQSGIDNYMEDVNSFLNFQEAL